MHHQVGLHRARAHSSSLEGLLPHVKHRLVSAGRRHRNPSGAIVRGTPSRR